MRRHRRLGLTAEGGIIFGAVMLVVVIVLLIHLFTRPPAASDEMSEDDKIWAQLLTTSDMARLGQIEELPTPEP